jgi:hypothetical protein
LLPLLDLRHDGLERLITCFEVAPESRDLAVLLGDRGCGRRHRRGQRVDSLHEHVESRREARLLLSLVLRGRQHD